VPEEVEYQTERLDHLGIVAGVCREAGIAEWLGKITGENHRVGTATVAQLYLLRSHLFLVPHF
jgi:hypothetical protein